VWPAAPSVAAVCSLPSVAAACSQPLVAAILLLPRWRLFDKARSERSHPARDPCLGSQGVRWATKSEIIGIRWANQRLSLGSRSRLGTALTTSPILLF
jgi:hypothetical protein